jgi:hypothetical protein
MAMLVVSTIVMLRTVRFEDVFITYRYGWNLAQGNGITWNASDAVPSEGYTTFTYVLLSGLFYVIKMDPLSGTQAVNLVCLAVLGYFMWQTGRLVFKDLPGYYALLPIAILVAIPATAFHVATGMETLFYMAALAGVSYFAVRWLEQGQGSGSMAGIGAMILMAGLTRPDGILYGLITLICLGFMASAAFFKRKNLLSLLVSLILPGLIYFIWRLSYFKLLLPLSFYHKSFIGGLYNHAARGVLFTDFVALFALPYLGIIFYQVFTRRLSKSAYLLLIPSLPLILYYSRVLAVAGLQYRFFFPYISPLLILAGNELAQFLGGFAARRGRLLAAILTTTLIAYLCLGPLFYETRNVINFFRKGVTYNEKTDAYTRIGKALLNIDPDETIGLGEVGKISLMLRDYTVVDIVGLNDRYLARNPFTAEYLDERKINILIVFAYPRAPLGVYADVYKKVGEGFEDIEKSFVCVGNIEGLDIFVRQDPPGRLNDFIERLRESKYFDEGICLSTTTARWAPHHEVLALDDWTFSELLVENAATREFLVAGNDPIFRSPTLNLDADQFNNVIVEAVIAPPVECSTMTLYFSRTDAPQESEDRSIYVPFTPEEGTQSIVFNVRMHPEWRKTIEHIRLDPVCGLNADGSKIKITLQSVILH